MELIFRAQHAVLAERRLVIAFLLLALMPGGCMASSIVGRVVNRSSNRPSAGEDVILYSVDHTMYEIERTKSSQDGSFRFGISGTFAYLIAVFHQGISYHSKTLRGSAPIEIPVYDSAQKVRGILDESNTLFLQPSAGKLSVTEFFVISNHSSPPRTLGGNKALDFQLPEGAVMDSTAIEPPGTLPLRVNASACGPQNQYCVAYPIRPGTTRLRVVYHLTQSQAAWITLAQPRPVKTVALMVPESSRLESRTPGALEKGSTQGGLSMYLRTEAHRDEPVSFRLSDNTPARIEGTESPLTRNEVRSFLQAASVMQRTPRKETLPQLGSPPSHRILITFLLSVALMTVIVGSGELYVLRFSRGGQK
jgi:hypothetical protein